MCQFTRTLLAEVLLLIPTIAHPTDCIAEPTLTFAGIVDIPPMTYEDGGVCKGLFPDLLQEIANRAGFRATVKLYPFRRLLAYLQEGRIDGAISVYYKKEREAFLIYSTAPVLISNTRLFVIKGQDFSFDKISDLFEKRVGVISGWALKNSELEQAIQEKKIFVDETTHYEAGLKKLMAKRIDCFVAGEQLTWYHASRLDIADDVMALKKIISKSLTYIGVSKNTPNIADPQGFMEKIDLALTAIFADGTYDRIQQRYGIKTVR